MSLETLSFHLVEELMVATGRPRDSSGLLAGALLMTGAVGMFAGIDGLAKLLSDDYSPVQVLWARYAFFVLSILMLVKPTRWFAALSTNQPWFQVGRAMLPLVASLAIIIGLKSLPLADATAILFAAPLMITLLSVPLLGERVGVFRWLAVACGFVGVVIVARPGSGIIGGAALWPLIGAFLIALFQIATRKLAGTADALTTLLYTAFVGFVISTAAVPFFWTAPTPEAWALFVVSGLLFGLSHFLLIQALAFAEASVLAPFNYAQMIVAAVLGWFLFGHFPDALGSFGMLVIIGAGLFVFFRQHRRRPV